MNERIEVKYQGVVIKITGCESTKNGAVYRSYQIADYSSGKRKRWTFADLGEAKQKAKQIAETTVAGQGQLLTLSPYESEIRAAFEALPPGIRLGRAVEIVKSCLQVVDEHEILFACRYWRENLPGVKYRAVTVFEGVDQFTGQHRASEVRKDSVSGFLERFTRKFGNRVIADIQQAEIEKWFAEHRWGARTVNDFIQITRQFWKHAIKSGWAVKNPALEMYKLKVPRKPVAIYTPDELRQQLNSLIEKAPELVPAAVVGAFGGLRITEVGRLDWEQVNQALVTGFIELSGTQTKTSEPRNVPATDNLRAWLMAFRKESGPVLPAVWMHRTKRHVNRLSELGRYIARKTKTKWKSNGWRHSYGTFDLKLHGDPHRTVTAMGNSLQKLNRNYMSKSQVITKQMAAEFFNIMPPTATGNVIPMPELKAA